MADFVHLHMHTEYSLLSGANRISELPRRIAELGMSACAITDHGVMYGALEFYQACRKENIKPIIGCEVYVALNGRLAKDGVADRRTAHLILLAENNCGLRNLNKLVTLSYTEGFYGKPRVDHELLALYHEGLIALSGCIEGEIPVALRRGDFAGACELARQYQDIFGSENFFLEMQATGLPEQNMVNSGLIRIAKKLGIPPVATNDCHYMQQTDATAHEILLCIKTGKKLNDEHRPRIGSDQLYIKSPSEMAAAFPDLPEALANTVRIAERCKAEFEFGVLHLPKFKQPEEFSDSVAYLTAKCRAGLERRLAQAAFAPRETYEERLKYELSVINSMGYTDYYLIVWDFIDYAKRNGIFVGPGRGSGAGSLAAFCLGITNIDPLRYNLIFERFLNAERVSMPDFDIDFCFERRQEVIDYVYRKYGTERVCQVITFGTMAAKAVVRDVARVLDYPLPETDKLAKMIPGALGMTLKKALNINADLKMLYEKDPQVRQLIDYAQILEGLPRHASTHAAGVIICGEPVVNYAPLAKNDEALVVQYTKNYIESIGLLKFDFLGLRTLTVLRDAAAAIKVNYGREIDFDRLDLADEKVFNMLGRGETDGVFQLESSGMTSFIKELRPTSLEDIIAGISLYRPGPMEQIPRYVAARHNPALISYDHPLLRPILQVTYGCIVYQEQVMQIVRDLAGFSMGMADIVRRAMAKKKPKELATYEGLFLFGGHDFKGNKVPGCIANGVEENVGRKIFNEVLAFAGYAFNKPHAASYAIVAYYTAWLRLYYPTEFMAAILNSFIGDLSKAAHYVQACRQLGIEVLPLNVNYSQVKFATEGKNKIRFALGAIKNVGFGAIREVVAEREANGLFKDPGDFWRRTANLSLNRKMQESLIRAGALDCFNIDRARLLTAVVTYLNTVSAGSGSCLAGQFSLFDGPEGESISVAEPVYLPVKAFSSLEKLMMEQELIGLYLTGHPLTDYRAQVAAFSVADSSWLLPSVDEQGQVIDERRAADGDSVKFMAFVLSVTERITRQSTKMARIVAEDFISRFEVVAFPKVWERLGRSLNEGGVYKLYGRVQRRDESENACLILQRAERVDELVDKSLLSGSSGPGEANRGSGGSGCGTQNDGSNGGLGTLSGDSLVADTQGNGGPAENTDLQALNTARGEADCMATAEFLRHPATDVADNAPPEVYAKLAAALAEPVEPPHIPPVPHPDDIAKINKAKVAKRHVAISGSHAAATNVTTHDAGYSLICRYEPQVDPHKLQKLLLLFKAHPGKTPTAVYVVRTAKLECLPAVYHIKLTPEFMAELAEFWGLDNLEVKLADTEKFKNDTPSK